MKTGFVAPYVCRNERTRPARRSVRTVDGRTRLSAATRYAADNPSPGVSMRRQTTRRGVGWRPASLLGYTHFV